MQQPMCFESETLSGRFKYFVKETIILTFLANVLYYPFCIVCSLINKFSLGKNKMLNPSSYYLNLTKQNHLGQENTLAFTFIGSNGVRQIDSKHAYNLGTLSRIGDITQGRHNPSPVLTVKKNRVFNPGIVFSLLAIVWWFLGYRTLKHLPAEWKKKIPKNAILVINERKEVQLIVLQYQLYLLDSSQLIGMPNETDYRRTQQIEQVHHKTATPAQLHAVHPLKKESVQTQQFWIGRYYYSAVQTQEGLSYVKYDIEQNTEGRQRLVPIAIIDKHQQEFRRITDKLMAVA